MRKDKSDSRNTEKNVIINKGEMRQKFQTNSMRIKIRGEFSKYLRKNNWSRKLLGVGEKNNTVWLLGMYLSQLLPSTEIYERRIQKNIKFFKIKVLMGHVNGGI